MCKLLTKFLMTICLLATANAQGIKTTLYTIKDLQILETERNYYEFFLHARDVRPSKRGELWEQMVVNMGESLTDSILNKDRVVGEDIKSVNKLIQWPKLRNSEFFRKNRIAVILKKAKSECLPVNSDNTFCKNLIHYWTESPGTTSQSLEYYLLTKKYVSDFLSSYRIIENVINTKLATFYCSKPQWSLQVRELALKLIDSSKDLTHFFTKDCWVKMQDELISELYSDEHRKRLFAYNVLNSFGLIRSPEKRFFHITYLLDNPAKGNLFNHSWTTLRELSKNHKAREAVLKQVKRLELLPDETFSSLNTQKSLVITRNFSKHFPEYIDFYARTCLEFLEGLKDFPNGNPTLHCREFFKRSKGKGWISHQLETRYLRRKYK